MSRRTGFSIGLMGVFLFVFCLRITQEAYGSPDELSELKETVAKLREENSQLQSRLEQQFKQQNATIETLSRRLESLEKRGGSGAPGAGKGVSAPMPAAEASQSVIPNLVWKGFTDVGFGVTVAENEDNSTFGIGMIDLFLTSRLNKKIDFLLETVFDFNTGTNEGVFELERAIIKYSLSDAMNLSFGRFHTPFGYWNQVFHHGSWLQKTVGRPQIYLFEDEDGGGFLPIHNVGGQLSGTRDFQSFDLDYEFGVYQGRGRTKTEVQNVQDKNDSKAVILRMGVKPHCLEGFQIGTTVYADKIPSSPGTATRTNRINELIVGGYSVYNHSKYELLGEAFQVFHDDKTSGNDFDSLGLYVQAAYKMHPLTPYYRFDFIDFASGDPFYAPDDIDFMKHTLGLRWDLTSWNALKFEYGHAERRDADNDNSFTVNSSFTF